ncbi:MAG: gliding motility protein GldM [Alloprevotella sp.]|nr:gliding motility protein GldM [Alloprevotella sp.]
MASTVKKRPVSPRQKMINLMYVLLMAMLALNVSNDVLKGFRLVGESLHRTTTNAAKENRDIYDDFAAMVKKNPAKVKPWYDKAMDVRVNSDSLYNLAEALKWAIAREADGKSGDPSKLKNQEDLNAAGQVMLAPVRGKGKLLYETINSYREHILKYITDPRQQALIASDLSTEVPKNDNDLLGKNWQEYMFEDMPAVAAITMLSKLQSDVRKAENQVLHTLRANVDMKDIRVNELNAYVLPEATTLFPGEIFRSHIFMAAVDTTQRPEIYVNGQRISPDGNYNFTVGGPGEHTLSGYILMPNAAGEILRREFSQKYTVIPRPNTSTAATVAADLMNVLYAGFDNPVSVSATGVSADKFQLSMQGGTLTSKGGGHYIARPAAVGQPVTFTVTGVVDGKSVEVGTFTFKVRKLPDPTAFITVGNDRFKGGRLSKQAAVGAPSIGAAIDDGLLDIPFKVQSFETVFFDRMGNARPEGSSGSHFTENQRNLMRDLRRGQRFYIRGVVCVGPDGITRTLPQALEVIVN